MKEAIVLDWDGVVFDDDAYKNDLFNALAQFAPVNVIEELYQSSKDHNGYNDRRLAAAVAEFANEAVEHVQLAVEQLMALTKQHYIYPDAKKFVTSPHAGGTLILLTAGDDRIQNAKIDASGLRTYFDHILVVSAQNTEIDKERALSGLLQEFNTIRFFDDRISTILHLHEKYRDRTSLVPILVDRSLADNDDAYVTAALSYEWIERQRAFHATPKTLIAAGYLTKDEHVLLIQETSGAAQGRWALPGGHVEADQTFIEASEREFKEESGISVIARGIRALVSISGHDYAGSAVDQNRHIIIACFEVSAEAEAATDSAELPHRWFDSPSLATVQLRSLAIERLVKSTPLIR